MKFLYCAIVFFLFLQPLKAQGNNELLKSQIEILFKNNEIDSINNILNKQNPLEPEHILKVLNRNLERSKKNNEIRNVAKTHLILGNFWHKQANKLNAFENYLQAESIARKINYKELLAPCLMNKSTLIENKKERIKTLKEASQIFSETKDTINLIKSFLNMGVIYSQLYGEANNSMYNAEQIKKFKDLGFENYAKAKKINQAFGDKELEATLYVYYGEWYTQEKQFEKAIQAFEKAKEILEDTKSLKTYAYSILMLARIASEKSDYNHSLMLLKETEQLAEKHQFNDYLKLIYEEYVKVYSQLGDYKQALKYSQLYAKISVKLTEQSNNDKMQILSLEKNLAENKLQINKYEADSRFNHILIILTIIVAIFFGGMSYLIIKNNRRKIDSMEKSQLIIEIKLKNQQLEDELLKEKVKFNQEHLISFANQVSKIEFFLDEMKTKFKKIPGSQEEINQLKLSFSELLNGQSQLKQINSLSSELNQDFFFYIKQNFPNISKGEEKLLAYIILNIGSKEISRILNISEKSIYIKRYRLRKKLNLENEETFEDFYQKIISSLN